MSQKVVTILAVLVLGEIQAQICSCGETIQQLIANPTMFPSQDLFTTPFNIPQIASTFVDNSVSNSLADTLQLLIVSDLIASNLNPRRTISPCYLPAVAPVCETVRPPSIFTPTVEFVPRTDCFPPPCAPVFDILQPRYSCIEPLPCLCGAADILSSATNIAPMSNSEFISANANLLSTFGPVSLKEIASPIPMASIGPCFCNGFPELLGPVTEIIYPPGIPPCNVGCASPPVISANLNFEPIPYAGVNYFY